MSGIFRAMKYGAAVLMAAIMLFQWLRRRMRRLEQSGLRTRAGFIIGVGGGSGTLRFANRPIR